MRLTVLVALALAAAIALSQIPVGYANWDGVATAGGTALNVGWVSERVWAGGDQYVVPAQSVSPDGKSITVRFGNLYPGAKAWWGGYGWNSGSMPAAFSGTTVTWQGDADSAGYLLVDPEGTCFSWDEDGLDNDKKNDSAVVLYRPVPSGTQGFKLMDLGKQINGEIVPGFVLNPITRFTLDPAKHGTSWRSSGTFALGNLADETDRSAGIRVMLAREAPNSAQGKTLQFTMRFDFTQPTED